MIFPYYFPYVIVQHPHWQKPATGSFFQMHGNSYLRVLICAGNAKQACSTFFCTNINYHMVQPSANYCAIALFPSAPFSMVSVSWTDSMLWASPALPAADSDPSDGISSGSPRPSSYGITSSSGAGSVWITFPSASVDASVSAPVSPVPGSSPPSLLFVILSLWSVRPASCHRICIREYI